MNTGSRWSRDELLVAFKLYCEMPFGKMHGRNPEIIKYAELLNRTPSSLAMKLTNIASLDPAITSSGRKGLAGASNMDRAMWEEMQSNWEHFALEIEGAEMQLLLNATRLAKPDNLDKGDVPRRANYLGTNKTIQAKARIGQDFFRRSVLSAYNSRCCITGLQLSKLLVASHIIPWRDDPANRLNPKNGLCLSALHDRAFDLGMITIDENMTVRLSRKYFDRPGPFFDIAILSFHGKQITLPEKFSPDPLFLEYHRNNIFEG